MRVPNLLSQPKMRATSTLLGGASAEGPLDVDADVMPEIRHTLGGLAVELIGKVDAIAVVVQAGAQELQVN
jgi:hypothetical protein